MSGETPSGDPSASRPVTSRKLLRLMAARSRPVGASAATAAGDGSGSDMAAEPTAVDAGWRPGDRVGQTPGAEPLRRRGRGGGHRGSPVPAAAGGGAPPPRGRQPLPRPPPPPPPAAPPPA